MGLETVAEVVDAAKVDDDDLGVDIFGEREVVRLGPLELLVSDILLVKDNDEDAVVEDMVVVVVVGVSML